MSTANPPRDYMRAVTQKIQDSRIQVLNPAERYLNRIASLPPAPMVVTELLTLFREPDRDVDQVVQLVSHEPSLTAQILRRCSSASFAGENPPGDIFEAVSRLGFYQVYCMVVSLVGAQARSMEGADEGVDVEKLWRHSVAVAVSASVVQEETGQEKAVAFTAGLLHDIGKLVLASCERESYARLFKKAQEEGVALGALERSSLGLDHAELGGELMHRWKLPPDVVAAVRYHHEAIPPLPHQHLIAAVQVGDIIAHQLFEEALANTDILFTSSAALDLLGLDAANLPDLAVKAQAEMENVKGLLEI